MSKLNKITEILEKGRCVAFMYAGGTQPNRLRIVNGADENCFYDIEDNTPKQFKEEKISNIFEADPALLELFNLFRNGSKFREPALEFYNKTAKFELESVDGFLRVSQKLYVRKIDGWSIGFELSLGEKRLDLAVSAGDNAPQEIGAYKDGMKYKNIVSVDDFIRVLEEFRDG